MSTKYKYNIFIKIISTVVIIAFTWQNITWADSDFVSKTTLQPRLVFSGPKPDDSFFHMLSGYLGFYLSGIENDPRNQNVSELHSLLNSELDRIKSTPDLPDEFKTKLPQKIEYDPLTASITIDLGAEKIRYFNHRIADAAFRFREGGEEEYTVLEKKIGTYLTRQILTRKMLATGGNPAASKNIQNGPSAEIKEMKFEELSFEQLSRIFAVNRSIGQSEWDGMIRGMFDEQPDADIILLENGKEIYGYAILSLLEKESNIHFFAIQKKIQKQGNGRVLVESVLDKCFSAGITTVRGEVEYDNNRMINWFEGILKENKNVSRFSKTHGRGGWQYEIILLKKREQSRNPDMSATEVRSLSFEPEFGVTSTLAGVEDAVRDAYREIFLHRMVSLKEGDVFYDFAKQFVDGKKLEIKLVEFSHVKAAFTAQGHPEMADRVIAEMFVTLNAADSNVESIFLSVPEDMYEMMKEMIEKGGYCRENTKMLETYFRHILSCVAEEGGYISTGDMIRKRFKPRSFLINACKIKRLLKEAETQPRDVGDKKLRDATTLAIDLLREMPEMPYVWELKASISRVQKEWYEAYQAYLNSLLYTNVLTNKVNIGHYLEKQAVDVFMRMEEEERKGYVTGSFASLYVFADEPLEQNSEMRSAAEEVMGISDLGGDAANLKQFVFFAVLPIFCAYINQKLQSKEGISESERKLLDVLFKRVEEGKLFKPAGVESAENVISYIYYLEGKAKEKEGKYQEAADLLAKSVRNGVYIKGSLKAAVLSILKDAWSMSAIERAEALIARVENASDTADNIDKLRAFVTQQKKLFSAYEKAQKEFEEKDYPASVKTIKDAVEGMK
ncbi:MAG: GNAT family N-acetyltransferase, partial [Candidatus Omnitrophica bacterium]|nr:GNAT family N-acetyltransferase [Candidatus Omnitrophota bacterium]